MADASGARIHRFQDEVAISRFLVCRLATTKGHDSSIQGFTASAKGAVRVASRFSSTQVRILNHPRHMASGDRPCSRQ